MGILIAARLDILPYARSQNPKFESQGSLEGFSIEDAVINVSKSAGKAVVSVSTEYTERTGGSRRFYFGTPFEGAPFEDDFFRRFFDEFSGEMPQREYKQMGLGSGVIIDPEGYILTNEHVVSGADKITVSLSDGREFKAELKGKDARSDLAIIKINSKNLPVARLGDSQALKIGQWVVAIGNPFGFALENPEPTVTVGVISALHRSLGRVLQKGRDYNDLIQTDAAINPGNSGGPLVNLKGEVVGINVAIFSTSGGYQGIGFAMPINAAKRILNRLIEGKKILYGWLGVTVQDLDDKLAEYFSLPDRNGVLVANVLAQSPAEKAGIKAGDIIKRFDDQPINNVRELLNIVARAEVGKKVKVVIIRDKKEFPLEVDVEERPQELEEISKETHLEQWRGLEVQEITPELAEHFGLKEEKGVVVTYVQSSSPADESGIMVGDVILEIENQVINNLSDYKRITQQIKGDAAIRTNRRYFVIKGK
jgi:serine protease Do